MSGGRFGIRLRLTSRRGELVTQIYRGYGSASWTYTDLRDNGYKITPGNLAHLNANKIIAYRDRRETPRRWRLTDRVINAIEAEKGWI